MKAMHLLIGSLCIILLLTGVACEGLDADEGGGTNQAPLTQQAKAAPDQARGAALAAVPGTVQGMRLERAAGKVIYDVDVQPANGGKLTEVEVDATTGQVLKSEPAGNRDTDEGD